MTVPFRVSTTQFIDVKIKKRGKQTAAVSLDDADRRFGPKHLGGPLLPMDFHPVSPISGPVMLEARVLVEAIYLANRVCLFIAESKKKKEKMSAFAMRSSFKIDQRRMIHKLTGNNQ